MSCTSCIASTHVPQSFTDPDLWYLNSKSIMLGNWDVHCPLHKSLLLNLLRYGNILLRILLRAERLVNNMLQLMNHSCWNSSMHFFTHFHRHATMTFRTTRLRRCRTATISRVFHNRLLACNISIGPSPHVPLITSRFQKLCHEAIERYVSPPPPVS